MLLHSLPGSDASVSMVSIAAVPRLAQNYSGSVESDDAEDSVLCLQSSTSERFPAQIDICGPIVHIISKAQLILGGQVVLLQVKRRVSKTRISN